jgi:plastocyanin
MKNQNFLIKYCLPIAGMFFLLTACNTTNQTTQEPQISSEQSPATETPSPAARQRSPVKVELTEMSIAMPSSLPAGKTVFQVTNVGEIIHNFEIEGQGIEKEFEENLKPGETKTLEVDLKPGTYRVYCPVGSHAEQGMSMELKVVKQ